jgi:hypothetical protein
MFRARLLTKWLLAFESVILVLGLMICCGVIPEWGRWYSPNVTHRLQTDALLHGHLALSDTPSTLGSLSSLAWAEGGVQQVSGLGIPIWRLPFEAAARCMGQPGFPDRLELGVAILIVSLQVFNIWLLPLLGNLSFQSTAQQSFALAGAMGLIVLLLIFPPFINLLRTSLNIYEEVLVYVYIYGISLMTGLAWLIRRPSWLKYWGICLMAGLGGLVRPTLVFYGIITIILATIQVIFKSNLCFNPVQLPLPIPSRMRRQISPRFMSWRLWVGVLGFAAGGLILFLTNQVRFGSGFEFGHKLNMVNTGVVYATRFDYPFEDEPLSSAARELCGALFSVKELNGDDFYRQPFFPGQSQTVRWRQFYFLTFDWSCATLVLIGWILGIWPIFRLLRNQFTDEINDREDERSKVCACMALWSLGSTALLAIFYLRVPCISSRYMMDFAPAFAGAIGVIWLKLSAAKTQRGWMRQTRDWGLLIILIGWMNLEITKNNSNNTSKSVAWEDVASRMESLANKLNLPDSTYVEGFDFQQTGIQGNGMGWNRTTNAVAPAVVLFIKDPEFVELEVSVANTKPLDNPPFIRAKVGLEFLKEESLKRMPHIWQLRFSRPMRAQYQRHIQPLFLAFGPKEGLADPYTPYRLLKVSWKAEDKMFEHP